MSDRPTEAVWVTRQVVTVQHIKGLLTGLEQAQALDFAQIRLMVLEEDRAIQIGGLVFTLDTLPTQGFLFFNKEEMPDPE